jgi:hypothetical protein
VGNNEGQISLPFSSSRAKDNLSDFNLFDALSKSSRFVEHFRNGEKNTGVQASNEARKAFQKSGDAGLSSADLVLWKNDKGIAMSLPQWQVSTGNDKHSLIGNITAQLDLKTFELNVTLDEKIMEVSCNPVNTLNVRDFRKFSRQIDKDFLSTPMASKRWLPGAFQNFKPGKNKLIVWPIKFEYPAMPPKVAIQPAPGSPGIIAVPEPSGGGDRR